MAGQCLQEQRSWLDDLGAAGEGAARSFTPAGDLYAENRVLLMHYTSNGLAPIDNNVLERDIEPFAATEEIWLFSDDPGRAKRAP